jgi:hypothetical protein
MVSQTAYQRIDRSVKPLCQANLNQSQKKIQKTLDTLTHSVLVFRSGQEINKNKRRKQMTIKAADLRTGMIFHDGSTIEVLSETQGFVNIKLSNGFMMNGQSVEKRIKKTSVINLLK